MLDFSYDRRLRRTMEIVSGCPTPCLPSKRNTIGDRLIPTRTTDNWQIAFHMKKNESLKNRKDDNLYRSVVENEVLKSDISNLSESNAERRIFNYECQVRSKNHTGQNRTLSPLSLPSQKLLTTPIKQERKITKFLHYCVATKDLDDNFYTQLVDWSSKNIIGVGLGSKAYRWNVKTKDVTPVYDLTVYGDKVTSVAWSKQGNMFSIGTDRGEMWVNDIEAGKDIISLSHHSNHVGVLAWNGNLLASGAADRMIYIRDIRAPTSVLVQKYKGHELQVCGLNWSPYGQVLASGGNDNLIFVWELRSPKPVLELDGHKAAVKGIDWSPHRHGILASGGGKNDGSICFWNTLTGELAHRIVTESQVCNLAWSKYSPEIVSAHGYPNNSIMIWKYPNLTQVAAVKYLPSRNVHMSMSPDGNSIVIGTGDNKSIQFWDVFSQTSKLKSRNETRSILNPFTSIR